MAVLSINNIVLSAIIAAGEEPKGSRRDIGGESVATDGTTIITRSSRKRDLSFRTIYLSEGDAHAWESLLIGEGEVWNFDTSLYGSKGMGPSASVGATIVGSATKFGAGKLNLAATTGSISFSFPTINLFNGSQILWTASVWRSTDSGVTWTNYIVRGTAFAQVAKWVDGVRNDGAVTTWLTVGTDGKVTIANTSGSAVQYDDLVVLPYWVLDAWPPGFGTSNRAWPPLPFLEVSGSWVTEQAFRRVFGSVEDSRSKVLGAKSVRLTVELKAR